MFCGGVSQGLLGMTISILMVTWKTVPLPRNKAAQNANKASLQAGDGFAVLTIGPCRAGVLAGAYPSVRLRAEGKKPQLLHMHCPLGCRDKASLPSFYSWGALSEIIGFANV